MIAIAIVLLIVGVVLVLVPAIAGRPEIAPLATIGWILVTVGVVLLVVALVFIGADDVDVHSAVGLGGGLAMAVMPGAHLHGPHDDDPSEPVAGSLTDRQPVLVAFIVGAIPILSAFALQVLEAADVLDSALWLRTLLVGLGSLTTALGALWARLQVTPTALPRLDDHTPLVPMVENEKT